VIGGVSMSGGTGKWYGTVIGALLIAVIGNGLDILNVFLFSTADQRLDHHYRRPAGYEG
jgi:ribose/xylose/arabinose/galactoside ABC-type transport system permease subunit